MRVNGTETEEQPRVIEDRIGKKWRNAKEIMGFCCGIVELLADFGVRCITETTVW